MDNRLSYSLIDNIVDFICDRIIEGQYTAGQKLPEVSISKELGVSRGSIREAFIKLEGVWMVENIPRKGCFVKRYNLDDVSSFFLLFRLLMQSTVQQLDVPNRRSQFMELETMGKDFVASSTMGLDLTKVVAVYRALTGICGDEVLSQSVYNLLPAIRRFSATITSKDLNIGSAAVWLELMTALDKVDYDKVWRILSVSVDQHELLIRKAFAAAAEKAGSRDNLVCI